MRISITGIDGFVGTYLSNKLKLNSENTIIPIDFSYGVDLTDWNQVSKTEEFDVLVHLAAKLFIPDSFENPQSFYYTNLICTLNALELCRKYNAKMVYVSSYVYGRPEYLPIDEKHPVRAFNPYAQSKLISEELCNGYNRDFGVNSIIIRPFNIYGRGQNKNLLFSSIIDQAKNGEINLKDSRPKRDYVYIDDVVNALIRSIYYDKSTFEVFNIGSGESYSVAKIADLIVNSLPNKIEVNYSGEERKNEILDTIADISKAKSLLDWQPTISLEEGLKKMID
jgi:UDP-glucose 4-epimerase